MIKIAGPNLAIVSINPVSPPYIINVPEKPEPKRTEKGNSIKTSK